MANNDTLSISFAIDADSISLSPIRDYEIRDIEGPTVFVGEASYRSSDLSEMDVDEVRDALERLPDNNDFKYFVRNCPTNTPLVYDDIDYLTRHLPSSALKKCQKLSEGTPFDKELLLLIAYVERQHSLIGHSDNVLEYYLEQRNEVAEELKASDGINVELERSFFSYLLLASALIEELATETVLNELFREETRLHSISEHVKNMGHKARLDILNDIQLLTSGAKSELKEVQKQRNNLVHDVQKRARLNEFESRRDAARVLEKTDRCVDVLLTISGKNIESTIARRGCDEYVDRTQTEAVADTVATWEHECKDKLAALGECDRATVEELHWDIEQSTVERFNITSGFEFEGFDDEALDEILQEFIHDASDAFTDRIDADANESNLDRFDFALMLLLCAGHDYDEIARWLQTDEKYVQRKENVITWRASEFENELVDRIPKPDEPIWPSNTT